MDATVSSLFSDKLAAPVAGKFKINSDLITPEIQHISAVKKEKKLAKSDEKISPAVKEEKEVDPTRKMRTVFVGNVPISVISDRKSQRALKSLFEKTALIESMRIRSLIPDTPAQSHKVAQITKKIHKEQTSCTAYVVFTKEEDATKAVSALNGVLFSDNHLRVDLASNADKPSSKKAIFLGNLPHKIDDETLWNLFQPCGAINNVRVVRDKTTGLSKGFGFVEFKEKSSVELALKLNGTDCLGRKLRISKCAKAEYLKKKVERKAMRKSRKPQGKAN